MKLHWFNLQTKDKEKFNDKSIKFNKFNLQLLISFLKKIFNHLILKLGLKNYNFVLRFKIHLKNIMKKIFLIKNNSNLPFKIGLLEDWVKMEQDQPSKKIKFMK